MKHIYVADIKPGDQIVDTFRVVEARPAPYKDQSKGHYLHLLLADRSGQVEARLWEGAEEAAHWLAAGDLARVKARAALYQDRIRLRVQSIEPAGDEAPELAELLPTPAVDVAEVLATIHGAIGHVVAPALRELLESFFGDSEFVDAFCLAPADRSGALLAQTAQVLDLADPVLAQRSIDVDLLRAAILLHGIGQLTSLQGATGLKAVTWLGVPALSDAMLVERLAQMPDFPAGLALSLRHAILSAGDPAAALTVEAAVLSHLLAIEAALRRFAA